MDELINSGTNDDKVKITEEVISTIAGIAVSEGDTTATVSGGLVDGIAGMLGRKNLGKGIKVELKGEDVVIDVSLVVSYGVKIHEVARATQMRVSEAVTSMTGLNVTAVNVNILGLNYNKDIKNTSGAEDFPNHQTI